MEKAFHCIIFLIKIWNPYNAFLHGFYRRNKNLVKEVGDEHLIVSLKQNGGEVPAHTA